MLLDMVDSLLAGGAGDAARLSELRDRLSAGRPVYSSDRAYVEAQFAILKGTPEPARAQAAEPDARPATAPAARMQPETEAAQAAEPVARPAERGRPQASSRAWYLLPVFMWLLGGVIAWACLRGTDPVRARRALVLGAGLSVPAIVAVGALAALFAYEVDSAFGRDIAGPDMTPEQVKRAAVSVPYESLVSDNGAYEGRIIRYEGRIVQVEKHPFADLYVMRIGTGELGIGLPTDDIWSVYAPETGSHREWLDSLDREGLVFSDNLVRAWGVPAGFHEYDTLFGGARTIPAVDVLILERAEAPQGA